MQKIHAAVVDFWWRLVAAAAVSASSFLTVGGAARLSRVGSLSWGMLGASSMAQGEGHRGKTSEGKSCHVRRSAPSDFK